MKKIFSRPSILPDRMNHYDEHGHKIGYSRPSLLGTYTNHYDEHGHKVGRSREGLFGTVEYHLVAADYIGFKPKKILD